jgi:oxygen-independent coproporphyrinogen-3 oxidase
LANTAYPIAHTRTIWHFRQPRDRHRELLAQSLRGRGPISLYAHIPFCERRCDFCEYCVVRRHTPAAEAAYHQALMQELELYLELLGEGQVRLMGFDIGGGTPSLVEPRRIARLLERVAQGFRLPRGFGVSIETTPKIAAQAPGRIRALRAMGIERISMGLQLVNPRLLTEYGRDLNDVGFNRRAVDNIRAAGFTRLNIDLMYGLARQSLCDLVRALEHAIDLGPEYITLYRMRYKGTRISAEAGGVELAEVARMYDVAREVLLAAGYQASPGKNGFSRLPGDPGTSAYLTSRVVWSVPYLGLGLGAQSFTNTLLGYNLGAASKRLERYLRATAAGQLPLQDLYHLPRSEAMAKMIAVSFYFGQIHLEAFERRFGVGLGQRFPAEIAFVLGRRLMVHDGPVLRLTSRGARVFNGVVALFYSDRVKQHLLER